MIAKPQPGVNLTNCPACDSTDIRFKLNTYDRHYLQHHRSFDVFMCNSCGLLFLNPMISEDDLHSLYPKESYYAYGNVVQSKSENNGLLKKIKHLIINAETHDPQFNDVGSKAVLDVGCGSGEKLMEFKAKGWGTVAGVEIDSHAAEIGKANGINIFAGTLPDANFPANSFDYVRSNHSFEHIIQNKAVLEEMYKVCKPGGKVFIGVPNTRGLNSRLFGKYWYYLGIPFHPFGYNPKNLSILIEKAGFKVEKVGYNGNVLGILGSMQIALNSLRGKKHSKGILLNKLFEIPVYQLSRLQNLFRCGDCIEVTATKPI